MGTGVIPGAIAPGAPGIAGEAAGSNVTGTLVPGGWLASAAGAVGAVAGAPGASGGGGVVWPSKVSAKVAEHRVAVRNVFIVG